jgi:hypothetical protein
MQNEEIKTKIKATFLERFGTAHPMQNEEVKERERNTCLARFGCENPFQNEEVKAKIKRTCLREYGTEFVTQNEEVKEKARQTCLANYGTEHPSQNEEIKERMRQTSLAHYGTPYPMQNPEVFERQKISTFKRKSYALPSGKTIFLQGYEHFAIEHLLKNEGIPESDIETEHANMPAIFYKLDEKDHRYYPDIFILNQRRFIEVKSDWTITQQKEMNGAKWERLIRLGFQLDVWVFDKNGIRQPFDLKAMLNSRR